MTKSPNNLSAVGKRRLLKLADLLEKDADNKYGVRFDLTAWAKKQDSSHPEDFCSHGFSPEEKKIPVNCSTAACAWGLAAISGAFKREGVGFKVYDNGYLVPTYEGCTEIDAAATFFQINKDQAWLLFDPDKYPKSKLTGAVGERYVAKRIRDFVAGKVSP
jgi:hypothetical protein